MIKNFVEGDKTYIIAPAGYGKTHTIIDCLEYAQNNGLKKQLVLTHTHAGIASIKQKLVKKHNLSPYSYNIETICGYFQKYVLSFYRGDDLPEVSSREYFDFIETKFLELLKSKTIRSIISRSYGGVFIDEYQDCSKKQHSIMMELSTFLPVHILGDSLQGIFTFNNIVEKVEILKEEGFSITGNLNIPYRWINVGNNNLGNELHKIRCELLEKKEIDLQNYQSIKVINTPNKEQISEISKILSVLRGEKSLLLLTHKNVYINLRKNLKQRLPWFKFRLLESIDTTEFYTLAQDIDNLLNSYEFSSFLSILKRIFQKTAINIWFSDKGVKNRKGENKIYSVNLKNALDKFKTTLSKELLLGLLNLFVKDEYYFNFKADRNELWGAIISSLKISINENITVKEALVKNRNNIRRLGRSVNGRVIGTTLLTKGLEFDTVIIIDAHKFECPKDFYVAITRATKKLYIFTENSNLNFKYE